MNFHIHFPLIHLCSPSTAVWVESLQTRKKILDPYKGLILAWLNEHPDLTAAEVQDWLIERHKDLKVGESTVVRAFVRELRKDYYITKETSHRTGNYKITIQQKRPAEVSFLEKQHLRPVIIFLGPPGVGKTHLSIGLGIELLNQGCKVIFTTMGDLIQTLKTEKITRKSKTRMKRIREADLAIIDDLMFMVMNIQEANMFFHLINNLYNQTSIILTSNKVAKEWGELLGDQAITQLSWIESLF